MYVCLCRGITDQDIKDAIENGAESYREIRDLLDLGTCCDAVHQKHVLLLVKN